MSVVLTLPTVSSLAVQLPASQEGLRRCGSVSHPQGVLPGLPARHLPHCTMLRKRMSQAGPIPCTTNTRWSICTGSPEEGRAAQGTGAEETAPSKNQTCWRHHCAGLEPPTLTSAHENPS